MAIKDKDLYELEAQRGWLTYPFSTLMCVVHEYWQRYRFWSEICGRVPFCSLENVLDVGCGVTSVLNLLSEFNPQKLIGVDPLMDEYLKLYPLSRSISWICARAEELPFADSSFDVVFCSNALDHVEDPGLALGEISRVLRPCGYLILTVHLFAEKKRSRDILHPWSFTRSTLRELLTAYQLLMWRLERRSPGLSFYTHLRLTKCFQPSYVDLRYGLISYMKSRAKELFGYGCLGEACVLCLKKG